MTAELSSEIQVVSCAVCAARCLFEGLGESGDSSSQLDRLEAGNALPGVALTETCVSKLARRKRLRENIPEDEVV